MRKAQLSARLSQSNIYAPFLVFTPFFGRKYTIKFILRFSLGWTFCMNESRSGVLAQKMHVFFMGKQKVIDCFTCGVAGEIGCAVEDKTGGTLEYCCVTQPAALDPCGHVRVINFQGRAVDC